MNVKINWQGWAQHGSLIARQYICGYCGKDVGAHAGYYHKVNNDVNIYLCPNCGLPTLFVGNEQAPGPMIGRDVRGLSEDLSEVYNEIRDSAKSGNHTSVILLARKLIMHVAVDVGDKENKSFAEYVNYLESKHYTPPNGKQLVDFIRKLGNQKNHEIQLGSKDESDKIVAFVYALLYFVYELKDEFVQE